jgi:hypothetical protein
MVSPSFVNYKKVCTQLASTSDKVYQLLVHGRWFSPGTPASSTTKTGHHDIAEILSHTGPAGFREDFLIDQSQTRTAYGSHISCMIST